jgi:gamma-glutamyl:cysteine ligase YbdK (ATP-grasp superfamily)
VSTAPLHLFAGVGVELEYMIVDAAGLAVRPIADELLRQVGGSYEQEVELGAVAWSNELALHVIEMKTNGPAPDLAGLGALFQQHVARIEALLEPMRARLMPTAMHPWMDPERELRLWPHENDVIYRAFDRIFDCRGHGWANLQSMHINLPFCGDEEFGRLHAAMRVLLPILPALAASSPVVEGRLTGTLDNRLAVYATNARRVPSVSGVVIPEAVYTRADYEGRLLGGIYADLAAHDPEGILCREWVNARGAIARFDRSAIEIRVLDVQECPRADIAIAGAVSAVLRHFVADGDAHAERAGWHESRLAEILNRVVVEADSAVIADGDYLRLLGFPGRAPARAAEVWQHLIETVVEATPLYAEWAGALEVIARRGSLARRIAAALGGDARLERLREVYAALCDCLRAGTLFEPDGV